MTIERLRGRPMSIGPRPSEAPPGGPPAPAHAPGNAEAAGNAETAAVAKVAGTAAAAPARRGASRAGDAPTAPAFDGLLKPGEAAAIIGVSRSLLEHWRTRGEGPSYVQLSRRHVLYRREHLEAFIEKCTVSDPAAAAAVR